MKPRRRFLVLVAAAAMVPLRAIAQPQTKIWRVGILSESSGPSPSITAFVDGMRKLGYVEGKNLLIEGRYAAFSPDRLAAFASELVQLKLDAILAVGTQPTRELQKKTPTIPIVMGSVGDPVASGFVTTLARPGGNITGLSNLAVDYSPKQLELLLALVPKLARVAVLVNPTNPSHAPIVKSLQATAHKTGVQIAPVEATTASEIDSAFATMVRERAGAVIVMRDGSFNYKYQSHIAALATKYRLPSLGGIPEYPEAGGLASYGTNLLANYRRAATYVDKIFKGAKPGELPVEQPTTLELVINVRAAKSLGVIVPSSVLARADKLIE